MGCPLSTSPWSRISLWHETAGDDWTPRPALPGDTDVDVAVVGAGFTGLWTAYYLAEADPSLRIAVLEAEVAGYGASGRNGGWCSALFPASLVKLTRLADREAALAQHRAMRDTVDEVARVAAAEGIDAHVAKGGTISLARTGRSCGARGPRWRTPGPGGAARTTYASWTQDEAGGSSTGRHARRHVHPDCAAVHPGRLVRGLATAVERRGCGSTSRPGSRRSSPARCGRRRDGARRDGDPRDRGLHRDAAPGTAACWRRCTR